MVMAQRNHEERALQLLATAVPALMRGAPWGLSYSAAACDAAATIWQLNRTDHIGIIEESIRQKVLVPDFRFPMRDSRLSIARLCALRGCYAEASEWFAKAREVLDQQGWLPLRAIVDYDEGLMYLRRGAESDESLTRPLIEAAGQRFKTLGMTGWLKLVEDPGSSARSASVEQAH